MVTVCGTSRPRVLSARSLRGCCRRTSSRRSQGNLRARSWCCVLRPRQSAYPGNGSKLKADAYSIGILSRIAPVGITDEARGHTLAQASPRVLLIGGPLSGPTDSTSELDQISQLYQRASIDRFKLVGESANFRTLVSELKTGSYDVVHFAGETRLDSQGDVSSSLRYSHAIKRFASVSGAKPTADCADPERASECICANRSSLR